MAFQTSVVQLWYNLKQTITKLNKVSLLRQHITWELFAQK